MNKYLDKNAIAFGAGAILGGIIFTMFVNPKLPASIGGGAL